MYDASSYVTTNINGFVKLRMTDESSDLLPISVPSLLVQAARESPTHLAMTVKRDDKWMKWTYSDYLSDVRCASRAFIKLGLEPRKGVAIMGFNSPEWFISALATVFCGSVVAGIYPTNSEDMTQYIANHCEANILVVEDDIQLKKVLNIRHQLPQLKAIIQYTGKSKEALSWDELMQIGRKAKDLDGKIDERLSIMGINQCCALCYTSGTTGPPKAVMLSHDNITYMARNIVKSYDFKDQHERMVSYLPLSHIAAFIADMVMMLSCRGSTYFADKNALKGTLTQTLKEAQPTIVLCVPRVYEKIKEKMLEVGSTNGQIKQKIGTWAKKKGLEKNKRFIEKPKEKEEQNRIEDTIGFKIANKLVYSKVKCALGFDKVETFLVGAAPFSKDARDYFLSLDLIINELYGMSECSGMHTFNTETAQCPGSVGRTMKGCQTKIDSNVYTSELCREGEILMGGRHVMMGYLKEKQKSAETVEDTLEGWLRTGDVGKLDSDGYLFITGRIKEILITAGGENVPPVLLEDKIKEVLPLISNAMVVGDRKPFLNCLLTIKTEIDPNTMLPLDTLAPSAKTWLSSKADIHSAKVLSDLLTGENYSKLADAIQKGINTVNVYAPSNAQKIQKWKILQRDFSMPGGELGPTLKLKRFEVAKMYEKEINGFYSK